MKKLLFAICCFVAALMSGDYANADIIVGGINQGAGAFVGGNGQLRTEDLLITAANGGGTFTLPNGSQNNIIAQNATTTVDIQAGSLIVDQAGEIFLGNDGGGNLTFNLSGGVAQFNQNVGIGRDEATTLVTISGGAFNVDGALSFDVPGGAGGVRPGFGTIDFTADSTGTLTVTGLVAADYEAFFAAGDITVDGGAAVAFGDAFQVSGNTLSLVASTIPEPSSLALLGLASLGMMTRRRR